VQMLISSWMGYLYLVINI